MSEDISMLDGVAPTSTPPQNFGERQQFANLVQPNMHDCSRSLSVTTANDLFQKQAPTFSGEINALDFESWKREIADWKVALLDSLPPYIATALLKSKLMGEAARLVCNQTFASVSALIDQLEVHFPPHAYRNDIITMLAAGDYFKGFRPKQCAEEAKRLYRIIDSDSGALAICRALQAGYPHIWAFTGVAPIRVTKENFESTLATFANFAEVAVDQNAVSRQDMDRSEIPTRELPPQKKTSQKRTERRKKKWATLAETVERLEKRLEDASTHSSTSSAGKA